MFIGEYQNSIDAKGRIIIPAKFREKLGYRVVLTKWLDDCLVLYTLDEWEAFSEKLRALPKADKNAREFVRYFTAGAEDCEVDKQGRLTIPQKLRDHARIDRELVTIGALDKIEIWSREVYEGSGKENICPDDISQMMTKYGI